MEYTKYYAMLRDNPSAKKQSIGLILINNIVNLHDMVRRMQLRCVDDFVWGANRATR
jgi:hypothetical protein